MHQEKKNLPMLIGFVVNDRTSLIHVWCPFCRIFHFHGATEDVYSRRGGYRIAHCFVKDSPFTKCGYYVKAMPIKFMKKFKKDVGKV